MDTAEAVHELHRVTYKPGWSFRFSYEPDDNGMITVFYECWVDNSSPRSVDPRERVLADGIVRLDARAARDSIELHRQFLGKLHAEAELHETREFYRVDGHAPFHPHRLDGRARWEGRVRWDAVVN